MDLSMLPFKLSLQCSLKQNLGLAFGDVLAKESGVRVGWNCIFKKEECNVDPPVYGIMTTFTNSATHRTANLCSVMMTNGCWFGFALFIECFLSISISAIKLQVIDSVFFHQHIDLSVVNIAKIAMWSLIYKPDWIWKKKICKFLVEYSNFYIGHLFLTVCFQNLLSFRNLLLLWIQIRIEDELLKTRDPSVRSLDAF